MITLNDSTIAEIVTPAVRDAIRLLSVNARTGSAASTLASANAYVGIASLAAASDDWARAAYALDRVIWLLEEVAVSSAQTRDARKRAIRAIALTARVSILADKRAAFVAV